MNDRAKPTRRWFQFKMRTLLIAVPLLALPLSWLAIRMEKARSQREAVEAIARLGGGVRLESTSVDATLTGQPITFR